MMKWRILACSLLWLYVCTSVVFAQAQFVRYYIEGEAAYRDGDVVPGGTEIPGLAEQPGCAQDSPDAPKKDRGDRVRLVSQQFGYFPEVYLALIYQQQGRYQDVLTYVALAKRYTKRSDPLYVALGSAESEAKRGLANPSPQPVDSSRAGGLRPPGEVPTPRGQAYALVIGIDRYDDATFPTLKTAGADAEAVGQVLRERYGFEAQILRDSTRHEILTAIDRYRRIASESSSILIYYAGHGIYDSATDKAYWLPRDAESLGTANWISADDITSGIRAIPARHVVVISDSCYSGGLSREAIVELTSADHSRYIDSAEQRKSRHLLSSGANEPVSDGGGGHSIFADALLRGLNNIPASDFTAHELFQDYVTVLVAGRSPQSPQYVPIRNSGHEGGDFVFHRTRNP
jgi:hypothetical protein